MDIPVLTLHQPWATLMIEGHKWIETRSWTHSYRGPLAIHASVNVTALDYLCWMEEHQGDEEPVLDEVRDRIEKIITPRGLVKAVHSLPLGAILGTVNLDDIVPMVHTGEEGAIRTLDCDPSGDVFLVEPDGGNEDDDPDWRDVTSQKPYGDFQPGRYGWLTSDPHEMREPVPFKGGQGLMRKIDLDLLAVPA